MLCAATLSTHRQIAFLSYLHTCGYFYFMIPNLGVVITQISLSFLDGWSYCTLTVEHRISSAQKSIGAIIAPIAGGFLCKFCRNLMGHYNLWQLFLLRGCALYHQDNKSTRNEMKLKSHSVLCHTELLQFTPALSTSIIKHHLFLAILHTMHCHVVT